MKTMIKVLGTWLLSLSGLAAQTAETWFLADGKTFEGQVRSGQSPRVLFFFHALPALMLPWKSTNSPKPAVNASLKSWA
jgi:hypothetical protein